MKVLVTGANGFVGQTLCAFLEKTGHEVVRCVRRASGIAGEIVVDDIGGSTRWISAVEGCQVLVHLAARVHVMRDIAADPLDEFRRTNVVNTLDLARQAAAAGMRRFVFISSIKVNGESTPPGRPFSELDVPAPQDPYGISKLEAEQGLRRIAAETGMEVVVIRPPLVYGPGVRANFLALMRAVARGLPLPLGAVDNRRSLVALDNLVDLILTCIEHPGAANQTFLVSDGEDLSTAELIRRMARAMGKPARLIPVPVWMLEAGGALLGKRDVVQRLCSSLQVDIRKSRDVLGWAPPIGIDEGLQRAAVELRA